MKMPNAPALGRLTGAATAVALMAAAPSLVGQTLETGLEGSPIVVGGVGPGGLAVLEAPSLSTGTRIGGLEQVHGTAISPDGHLAYAVNMVDPDRAVTIVDVEAAEIVRSVALPGPGHHAAVSPSDGRLYVTYGRMGLDAERPRGVAALSPGGDEIHTVKTDGTAYYVALAPDGSRLYVATQHPNRLLVLGLPEMAPLGVVELEEPPGHLAVTALGDVLFAVVGSDAVVRIDLERLVVDGQVPAGPDAHTVALAGSHVRLFVGNRDPGTVTLVDPTSMAVVETRKVTPMLTHLLALSDGTLLVSGGAAREILHLDPESLDVLHRTKVPFQPHQTAAAAGAR